MTNNYSERDRELIAAGYRWGLLSQREGYDPSVHRDTLISGVLPPVPDPTRSPLFERLLSGKAPLAYAPPARYGNPWYEAIESEQPIEVDLGAPHEQGYQELPDNEHGYLAIDGAYWEIIDPIRENQEYLVRWGKYPLRWRLKRTPENTWTLQREGMRGFVWAGSVVPEPAVGAPIEAYALDQDGPRFLVGDVREASTPTVWVWVRVEVDQVAGEERYLRFAREGTDAHAPAVREWMDAFDLEIQTQLLDEVIHLIDRHRTGRILRGYTVHRDHSPWGTASSEDAE